MKVNVRFLFSVEVFMPLMNMRQIGQEIGVSPHTIRVWVRHGYIPHVRAGRQIRFDAAEVREWLKRRACPGRDRLTPEVNVPA